MIDFALYFSYALIAIAALSAIILPLINSFDDPKSLIKTGAGLLGLVVIFIIGYIVADSEVTAIYTRFDVDASTSKIIGGFLIMTYILFFGAIISILVTEVTKLFN